MADEVPYKILKALSDGCHEISCESDRISKDESKRGLT